MANVKKRGPGRPKGSKAPRAPRAPKAEVAPAAPSFSALGEAAMTSAFTEAMSSIQASANPKGVVTRLALVPAGTRVVLEGDDKSETYPVIAIGLMDTGAVVPVVHDADAKTLVVLPVEGVPIKSWLNPGE